MRSSHTPDIIILLLTLHAWQSVHRLWLLCTTLPRPAYPYFRPARLVGCTAGAALLKLRSAMMDAVNCIAQQVTL